MVTGKLGRAKVVHGIGACVVHGMGILWMRCGCYMKWENYIRQSDYMILLLYPLINFLKKYSNYVITVKVFFKFKCSTMYIFYFNASCSPLCIWYTLYSRWVKGSRQLLICC